MKNNIVALLSQNIPEISNEELMQLVEIPPKTDMGDFAFPCFRLAKVYRKAPPMIAQDLKEKIGDVDFLDKIEVQGGYLNFFVKKEKFAQQIIEDYLNTKDFGSSSEGEGQTICIDYSSPNVAKNFHVGHLRTTIIGNSLHKIFKKLGYNVVRINHLGDWGTQFGKLIVAYKKWGSKEAVEKDGISELMSIYVKFHDEAEKDPSLNDEARAWFTKMEHGDEEALSIWRWFLDISLKEFMRVYDILGMDFDSYNGESFYNDKMPAVIEELKEKNLITVSDGAQIVDLEEYNMPPCLITKKDGSSLYATRDIAAALYRQNTYHFTKCLYVTGLEQKLHFAQWFKVIELMGYDWYKGLVHIPYGLVSLKSGKLSTRKGNVLYAEDILKESIQKIREIIDEKNPDLPDKETVAKQVGIGAIIFNDLYNQRIKDVLFDWDKLLNFDGETGPYVQYTYARAASVLRKIGEVPSTFDYSILTDEASMALLKEISRFPDVVKDAAEKYEPCVVARYAVSLAQTFNKFYHDCQINVEDDATRYTRANVVSIVKNIIKAALDLLGISCPEQM
ncbi:MAG TPA: arginine--tRNA ligase [Candidatus Scybalocola faecigallinarum]|uniref:Arginine--tRNA ligase n=1 Tax=Candidatus Scybalocola faecigallinarum TaxID=2840941 RepID=A0A9D1F282_9FIRM|nr:arginine--tRNA ligase [Candidatus Scybalocola faecigallinarum]